MRARLLLITGCILTTMFPAGGAAQEVTEGRPPLEVSSLKVTIEGTSKSARFFASTNTAQVTRLRLAEPRSPDVLQQALRPGQLEAFDVTIPVTTLTSPDKAVNARMRYSLKADTYPEIRFQLRSITNGPDDARGFVRLIAHGTLTIAGQDRDVALSVTVLPAGKSLLVDGGTYLLMNDFGVTPPPGLLGLLKTDALVHVRFELVVTAAD